MSLSLHVNTNCDNKVNLNVMVTILATLNVMLTILATLAISDRAPSPFGRLKVAQNTS